MHLIDSRITQVCVVWENQSVFFEPVLPNLHKRASAFMKVGVCSVAFYDKSKEFFERNVFRVEITGLIRE